MPRGVNASEYCAARGSLFRHREAAEARGGRRGLADAYQLVAEVHSLVVAVGVFGVVDLEQAVEVAQKIGAAHIEDYLVANLVPGVHLEGAAIVGGVDYHHALHVVAGRHIGDVELLAFSPFVAHEGTQRLHDVVRVAAQLLGDVRRLCLYGQRRRNHQCKQNQSFHRLLLCNSVHYRRYGVAHLC